MTTTFTPGQHAVVTIRGNQHNAVRDSTGAWLVGDIDDLRVVDDTSELVTAVQLLPALNPLDQRAMTRFREQLLEAGIETDNRTVARALTALAPRPPEPQGLGAVVLDIDGKRWLRDGMTDDGGPWFYGPPPRGEGWERREYDQIQVLEIRSNGDLA